MLYRDHKEYNLQTNDPNNELLRSWLRGDSGVESLKEWLDTLYG